MSVSVSLHFYVFVVNSVLHVYVCRYVYSDIKLDGTPAERRLSSERNNGGKNGGEERKRKTKAKTIGLDDVGGIR